MYDTHESVIVNFESLALVYHKTDYNDTMHTWKYSIFFIFAYFQWKIWPLSYYFVWMQSIRNTLAYELQLFDWFGTSYKVT